MPSLDSLWQEAKHSGNQVTQKATSPSTGGCLRPTLPGPCSRLTLEVSLHKVTTHPDRRDTGPARRGCRSGFWELSRPSARWLPWFQSRPEWPAGAHRSGSTESLFDEPERLNHSVSRRVKRTAEVLSSSLVRFDPGCAGAQTLSYALMSLDSRTLSKMLPSESKTTSRYRWSHGPWAAG